MEINIRELFELFTSKIGHKVIAKTQDKWRSSSEGWDHHALIHMGYWTLRDVKNFTHAEACKELEVKTKDELLKYLLTTFFHIGGVVKEILLEKPESSSEVFIFTPQNELETAAIQITTKDDGGWQGCLYKLEYYATENDELCLIFATKPPDVKEQEWLLVIFNQTKGERYWSVHTGSLKQVYYKWAEKIGVLKSK
ncbi:hypothetical protein [Nostoc sp.]|jgi:hypothetical protein|uniref:hypothetical protein n=1 Tax=Nostoc sp. TaxID=1180 RepID=UPI002FFB5C3F